MEENKNYQVYREQLHENVKELLTEDIGNVNNLSTESKSLVGAINEIIGKDVISSAIGSPLVNTDTWSSMGKKIDQLTQEFRDKLVNHLKLEEVISDYKINELINSLENVYIGNYTIPEIHKDLVCAITCPPAITNSTGSQYNYGSCVIGKYIYICHNYNAGVIQRYNVETEEFMILDRISNYTGNMDMESIDTNIYCIHNINRMYDTNARTFTIKTSPPSASSTSYPIIVRIDNYIYMLHDAKVYFYDPVTDSYTQKVSLPDAKITNNTYGSLAAYKHGFFGISSVANATTGYYSVDENTWTVHKFATTTSTALYTCGVINDTLYYIGDKNASSPWRAYNILTQEFRDIYANYHPGAPIVENIDNVLYVIGGHVQSLPNNQGTMIIQR